MMEAWTMEVGMSKSHVCFWSIWSAVSPGAFAPEYGRREVTGLGSLRSTRDR